MPKRKPTTYNRILKEFTKVNNKLPEDRKLSIQERRKIIKEELLPAYKGIPHYKVRIKKLKKQIFKQLDRIPPKEICDLNYIDASEFAQVEWFSLDETITELVPDCVYIKISAGDYGETRIFNTRDYQYGRNGVRKIVEEIRPDAVNQSGKYIFSAYRKLRPKKRNDGTPENYYLDFILIILDSKGNETPQGDTDTVSFDLPRTREVRKKKTKIKNIIEQKIKSLKSKRDSRKRAKKTLEKNIKQFTKTSRQVSKAKRPSKNKKALARKQFLQASKLLEKYFAEGKLTQYQYDKALERILKEFYED
jgi:hypothetical protein